MSVPAGGTLPDIEGAVIKHLRERVGWTDYMLRSDVTYPALRLVRVGGAPADPRRLDVALVQLEAWGRPEDEDSGRRRALVDLLNDAVASLVWELPRTVVDGVAVKRVQVLTHCQWAPDATTKQPRYFTRLTVTARPA